MKNLLQHGVTLLELLLVVTVIAVLSALSLQIYRHTEHQQQIAYAKDNVSLILLAGNTYFHATACNSGGVFPHVNTNVLASGYMEPTFITSNDIQSLAWFDHTYGDRGFELKIIDTGTTQAYNNKPIYALQLSATFANGFTQSQKDAIQHILHARYDSGSTNVIQWQVLPGRNLTGQSLNSDLWMVSGTLDLFRQQENFLNSANNDAANACVQ